MKHGYSSSETHKGCHSSGHSSKMFSHLSTGHSGGSHHGGSHQGGFSHHGGSHISHHGGSHLYHHGGSQLSNLGGGNHFSHHGGFHMTSQGSSHHGGSHTAHYGGGPHLTFHGGSHHSHHKPCHGSSHLSHHGSSTKMHHGSSHMSHHGGSMQMSHGGSHMSHSGGSHKMLHGSHQKSASNHGGSSSKSVSFAKHASKSHHGGGHSHGGWKKDGFLSINEKETMQMLNGRLSSYLDKVSALEQENAQLERKICEWYANNAPSSLPDSSQYFRIITDLQNQISGATMENARIVLQIDNARLAADDFHDKYEMERSMSNNAEADLNALRRVLEGLNREICDLEMQVQNLQEELQEMKKNHEEEVNVLRAQLGARINVELNAAPSIDLNRALAEIRDEYENLMQRNLTDAENMFRQRSDELNREVISGSEQLQSVQTEVIELKRCVQTLEIELQSQLSMTSALENTLAETQATYGSQIAQLQAMINSIECELGQIRSDLERQNNEYKILMDQKTHLEMEIATYKRLLDGHDIHAADLHMSSGNHGSHGSHHKVVHHATDHHHDHHQQHHPQQHHQHHHKEHTC